MTWLLRLLNWLAEPTTLPEIEATRDPRWRVRVSTDDGVRIVPFRSERAARGYAEIRRSHGFRAVVQEVA